MEDRIEVGIDWIQGTVPYVHLEAVIEFLSTRFGVFHAMGFGRFTYHAGQQTTSGVSVYYSADTIPARPDVCVVIPGSCLSGLSGDDLFSLCCGLARYSFSCTRIDARADDYAKIISPAGVYAAARESVEGFRSISLVMSNSGETCYFGKRGKAGGGRQVVVYDKSAESDGEIDAIRWEARYYKEVAEAVFFRLLDESDGAGLVRAAGKLVGGAIGFPQPGTDQQRAWWIRIGDLLGRCFVRVRRTVPPWDKYVAVAKKRIGKSLAVLHAVLGNRFADYVRWDIVQPAIGTLSPIHRALIDEGLRLAWREEQLTVDLLVSVRPRIDVLEFDYLPF